MFRLASLFVEIGAHTNGLTGVLANVHNRLLGMGAVGQKLSGVLHGVSMGFAGLATSLGPISLAIVAIGAAVGTIFKVAMAAGHLNEAISKAQQTFGTFSTKVIAAADEMAAKFGIVKTTFIDAASSFGLMLEGAGINRTNATEMSIVLTKLAADAKAFFDVPFDEALQRLQSGLAGETEAVRRWGIDLSEASLKQKAMAMGLSQGNKELDASTKLLVRYALILERTKPAQGALERESGGLVSQWEKLTGSLSNLAATMGGAFAVAATNVLKIFNVIIDRVIMPLAKAFAWLESSWESLWAKIGNFALGAVGIGDFFTTSIKDAVGSADLSGVDKRLDASNAAFQNDAAAAGGTHQPKGWQGGLEEFAKHLQEGAFGSKDKTPQEQLKAQQIANDLLQKLLAQGRQGNPVIVGP